MIRRKQFRLIAAGGLFLSFTFAESLRPNIVLIMADDQGWGETGYYNHPVLKTPELDAMARNGLRFDRFYAGAPVCSPTRASVLTGRVNDRCGVPNHGHGLRHQEKTLPAALRAAGYATGHFGKWHLNALHGPGVPICADDPYNPGVFGFDEWLSASNYFDQDPVLGRKGVFEQFDGDSSDVVVEQALKFIHHSAENGQPFFAVIWGASPHKPWIATENDKQEFTELDQQSREHYGEMAAFDRSVGALRRALRELHVADNTLVWYCSDNGGLPGVVPDTTGGLRDYKKSVYEGGLRVPSIIEWPAGIKPRLTDYPASTLDIFPTIAALLDLSSEALLQPVDGISLVPLFAEVINQRPKPIPFRYLDQGAWVDNRYKLVVKSRSKNEAELFDLIADSAETTDLSRRLPEVFDRMLSSYQTWSESVDGSVAGEDYTEPLRESPEPHFWMDDERYTPFFTFNGWNKATTYKPAESTLQKEGN